MEGWFITKYSVWILIVTICLQACPSRSCLEREKVALLQLKSYFMSVTTDEYIIELISEKLRSWNSNGEGNCCLWERVTCNNSTQHVTHLDLHSLMYADSGKTTVPLNVTLFEAFGELISLDLSFNRFNGLVGNGGYNTLNLKNLEILYYDENILQQQEFANLLRSLTSLKELSLGSSNLGGKFPGKEMSHLKKLEVLDLSRNYLHGSILGQDLAHLKKLRVLDLGYNNLNGFLQDQGICGLRNLEELALRSNALSGSIPKCLWNLTYLQFLDLSHNSFSGDLPPLINLPSLYYLSICANNFHGRISLCYLMNHSRLVETLELSNNVLLHVQIGDALCSHPSELVFLGLRQCSFSGQSNTFPKFLSNLSSLHYLDLSSSGLTGLFPDRFLERNPDLEYLNMRNNSVAGTLKLPKQSNQSLFYFDVSSNKLNGKIPAHIGMVLSSFSVLNMSHNSIEGHIPASVGNMTQLSSLDLSNNHLVGEIPRELFTGCTYLRFLLLSNNNLQGEIIPSYMNLPFLEVLSLNNNIFGGTIKGSLLISELLRFIDISNNSATGELPSWIGKFGKLESMSLAGNEFHGYIPSQLCKLKSLEFLDLSKNRFTGGIPSCDILLPLKFLHMHGNRLTGAIPQGLTKFSSLVTLDLSNNRLSGVIPQRIDQLSKLVILLLGGNQLGGELPNQLCRLQYVNIINLSNNDISGSIPTCFRNLSFGAPELATLYTPSVIHTITFGDNDLPSPVFTAVYVRQEEVELVVKSRYSSYNGKILSLMSELDLSDNKLAGEIPPELGELGKIQSLNLSYNRLSGSIPRSFSKLKSIESLDLSNNNLSGTIPSELVDLTFLEIFNVSYNNLSGEVPETGGQFGTFDESNYQGNPLLCGSRLSRSCNKGESEPTGNTSTEEGDEGFDMEVFLWSFGMSSVTILITFNVVLAINPYWRRAWFAFLDVKFLWWFHN